MENRVEWLEPSHNLRGLDREQLIADLANALRGRVESAFLFGSYAKGDYRPDSDIDLILVVTTNDNFVLRPLKFNDLLGVFPRIDMFVYTPKEFQSALQQPSFVSDQSRHWRQLI